MDINIYFILYIILVFANFSTNYILFNNLSKIQTEFTQLRYKIYKLEQENKEIKRQVKK